MDLTKGRVLWGTMDIRYTCEFSRRKKTMAISVHPDLSVSVKAPEGTPEEVVKATLRKRGQWIKRSLREFELYLPKQPERRYISGESHRYLGRQHRLKVRQGNENSVKCLRGYLWVTMKDTPSPQKTQKLLEGWYREHALRVFQERYEECYKKVVRHGIPKSPLRIQRMQGRWGSCSPTGQIILNLELIKAPKDCIDYVITHELCHHKEKHHGPRFWRLLSRVMPDYAGRVKRLAVFGE